jgi:hypothetical protein
LEGDQNYKVFSFVAKAMGDNKTEGFVETAKSLLGATSL